MSKRNFKIYRGDDERGELVNYKCEVTEGMVVLDAILKIQANQANDLAGPEDDISDSVQLKLQRYNAG